MWIFWTIVLCVIGVTLMLYSWTGNGCQGIAGVFCAYCFLGAFILSVINKSKPTPTALDVYRGNTKLKITSVNGVPTDTVVVFKNK